MFNEGTYSPTRTPVTVFATTSRKTTLAQVKLAKALAGWFDCPYVDRQDRGLEALYRETGATVLVLADDPVRILHKDTSLPLFFHPSMAAQRMERMARGESDRLIQVSGATLGDSIVDASLGLASDALVFCHVVGRAGQVIGLEASPVVAKLLTSTANFGSERYRLATDMLKQIKIHQVNHTEWLREQTDDSVDIIYFDPMFRSPQAESASISPLRLFAKPDALSPSAIEDAKRVARKCVVIKERPSSGVFERYGFTPDYPRRNFAYGVWQKR